jgi:polysaccharide export outer membrane protein
MPLAIMLAAATALAGCSSNVEVRNPQPISALSAPAARAMASDYVLAPGDELAIKFFYNPELNEERVFIRPDGRISLQLVGQQQAAGLNPSELERQLEQSYGRHLRQSNIAVITTGFAGQRVFIDGEVGTPSAIPLTGNTSVMQAIASAGGFKNTAYREQVILIRKQANGPIAVPLNMTGFLDGSTPDQDVTVRAQDIVFVPRSPVANMNLFIEQYFRNNIPIPFGIGYGLNN